MDIDAPKAWTDGMGEKHTAPSDRTRLTEVLTRADFSHFSYRSWCGQNLIYAYKRDPGSPSGCMLIDSFPDCDEIRAIISNAGKGVQAGGQMGHAACAAGMTGGRF
jgi:hypothetical protein